MSTPPIRLEGATTPPVQIQIQTETYSLAQIEELNLRAQEQISRNSLHAREVIAQVILDQEEAVALQEAVETMSQLQIEVAVQPILHLHVLIQVHHQL